MIYNSLLAKQRHNLFHNKWPRDISVVWPKINMTVAAVAKLIVFKVETAVKHQDKIW